MNNFHKVRLVDEEELTRIIEKRIKDYNPNLHVLGQMELEMDSILKQPNLNPDEKLTMFQGIQNKFRRLKENFSQPAMTDPNKTSQRQREAAPNEEALINLTQSHDAHAIPPIMPEQVPPEPFEARQKNDNFALSESVLGSDLAFDKFTLPDRLNKSYEAKYSNLLALLKSHSNLISVDPHSREVLLSGKQIAGSDLSDLIHNLYRPSEYRNNKGATEFHEKLNEIFRSDEDLDPAQYISNKHLLSDFSRPSASISGRARVPNRYSYTSYKATQSGNGINHSAHPAPPPGNQIRVLYLYPH